LSKTVGLFAVPSNLIIALGVVGLLLLRTRWVRTGRRLIAAALLLIVLLGILPVGTALTLALEQRFPRWQDTGIPPHGIIVLGGAISPGTSAARGAIVIGEAAERVTEVAALARRYPEARIVFSGGNANLVLDGPPEAVFAARLFESFGIAPTRVLLESRSRNTAENARFAKTMLDPKPGERWLLVTSATHMPRAIGCFRAADFPVEAYPVDWHTKGVGDLLLLSPPLAGLAATDMAVKEWVGLVVYWLTGRSSALFPGPEP
jgi:uncharacterized SAM-binding protein YcdF (DUF218 family)